MNMKKDNGVLYEYEREPVPQRKLYLAMCFASAYAGEHTVATEFLIGVLLVTWGASVYDIIIGLFPGNLA